MQKTETKTTTKKSVASQKTEMTVIPSIVVDGHKNPFIEAIESGKEFNLTAIGCFDMGQGRNNNWVSYILKIKGDRVVSMEVEEPNMHAIAIEASKTAFVTHFMPKEI